MPFPYADRDWTNVPTGTTPPPGAPVADDAWFEAAEDAIREHDAHLAANYAVHGGVVWYINNSGTPPTSPPTGLPWWRPDTKEAVVNTGTSGSPVWEAVFVDPYKLTSADLVTDYVVNGLLAAVPSNSLTLSVPSGVAIITGKRISKSSASWSVPAGKHTFVDLTNAGAFANVDNGVLLDDCEDTWLEKTDPDFTQSIIAGQVGNALRLAIAAGASAGDSVSEAIPSTDISGYGKIRLRIRSSVGTSAGDLQLLLDNTAQVASPVHTLNIPTLTANTWTTVELAYTATTGSEAIISVGLKYAVDIGAVNVDLDDIWAVKTTEPAVTANALRLMEVKADANIAQVSVVDITSAVNSTLYTVQINSVDVTYTSDSSATEGEIALGLVAAVNASVDPGVTPVTASTTAISSDTSATLTLTADGAGVAFTVAVGANLSVTTTVPNSTANVYEVIDRRTLNPSVRGTDSVADHGLLTGLADDDHTQYYNQTRGDARYEQIANKDQNSGYAGLNSSGRVPVSRLASGTPDGTKFVKDDGTLAVPPGSGVTDHGALTGLGDDDHTIYALTDGTRLRVYRGTSAPSSPSAGQLWADTNTTPPTLKEYTGSAWGTFLEADLDAHLTDTTDAHDASAISVADSGSYFTSSDVEGALQELGAASGASAYRTLVTLGSDVTSTSATLADVTGLSFSVTSGVMYRFEVFIIYTTGATTQGSKFAINGPASPTLIAYETSVWLSQTNNSVAAHNSLDSFQSVSNTYATSGTVARITGFIKPSASGTVIVRFATPGPNTITVKAGSTLEWW